MGADSKDRVFGGNCWAVLGVVDPVAVMRLGYQVGGPQGGVIVSARVRDDVRRYEEYGEPMAAIGLPVWVFDMSAAACSRH